MVRSIVLTCAKCCRRVREEEAEAAGWRHRVDESELHLCGLCAYRDDQSVSDRPI